MLDHVAMMRASSQAKKVHPVRTPLFVLFPQLVMAMVCTMGRRTGKAKRQSCVLGRPAAYIKHSLYLSRILTVLPFATKQLLAALFLSLPPNFQDSETPLGVWHMYSIPSCQYEISFRAKYSLSGRRRGVIFSSASRKCGYYSFIRLVPFRFFVSLRREGWPDTTRLPSLFQ